jgi:outer membrane autotransporter protein
VYHIGGVLGRMDFNAGPGKFYTEGSFRIESVSNEYKNPNLGADYDSDSAYYGIHAGLGYIWNINDKAALDFYGKYFWTRQGSDSVRLSSGDPVSFKDIDSHRLQGGARFTCAVNEYVTPYVGAAYEHELDGKARASTYGYSIDSPKLTGGTGIGELGLNLKPSQTPPLSCDLGVQGYVGKREGVTGSLQIKWEF